MQNRVSLARKQRIYVDARLFGQLFEAVAHQFVRHENLALFLRKLVESIVESLQQHGARVSCIRTGTGPGKQLVEQELFAFLVKLCRLDSARLAGLSAKQV